MWSCVGSPPEGGELTRLTSPGRELSGVTVDEKVGRMAFAVSDHTHPGEIASLDPNEGGEPRVLTGHNDHLLNEALDRGAGRSLDTLRRWGQDSQLDSQTSGF